MNMSFTWPNNTKCAVSLTYDDGLISQLDNALPALRESGIKATFFLSGASLTDPAQGNRWKQAVKDGHELGCHTIHHACDAKWDFVRKGYALQDYDAKRLRGELEENIKIINSYGYNPEKYVFAYPCGESALGPGMKRSYVPLIREMFYAARAVKKEFAAPGKVDLHETPSIEAPQNARELIALVDKAKQENAWAIILFHGVGGDYIQVSKETHEEFIKYLAENRDSVHTDCFGGIAGLMALSK